jgi:tRNA (uracil-5-)-methyltransferase TRM9
METTREVFDQIAPGWYGFRHWTIFRRELEELAVRWRGGRLLNVGCGHGPDFLPFREKLALYGMDFSYQMLNFARQYAEKFGLGINLVLADAVYLPFADDAFDWAISVATYHHIRGSQERLAALRELRRVLKPGGEAFITVWNRYQPGFWFKGKETLVPWRTKETTLYRYYYLFSYGELEKLARQAGFKLLRTFPESSYHFPVRLFSRNICLLVRKG